MDGFDLNKIPHTNFIFDYKTPDGYLPFGYTKHTFGNVIQLKLKNTSESHTGYYSDIYDFSNFQLQRGSFFSTHCVGITPKTQFDLTTEVKDNPNSSHLYLVVLESLNVNNLFEYYSHNEFEIEDFFSPNLIELLKTHQNFKIVFMDSREGSYPHDISFLVKINNFLDKFNINHPNKVFISTNNNFIVGLENKDEFKTFKNRIVVFPNNYCLLTAGRFVTELYSKDNKIIENDYEYSMQVSLDFTDKEKYFLMYNRNSSRVHRPYFVNKLYKNNLLSKGYVSFFENDDLDNFLSYDMREYSELNLTSDDIRDIAKNYKNYTPLTIDDSDPDKIADFHNFLSRKDEYINSYFTIVSETNAEPNYCFITEKTIKPIMNLHPFLILGNPHTLKVLKDYGFLTFDKWWDESYDNEFNFKIRANMIFDIVNDLCNKSKSEWNVMLKEMEPVLVFNKKLLHRLSYTKQYEKEFFKNINFNQSIL